MMDGKVIPFLPRLWATKERGKWTRTITLVWMMWLTTKVFLWAMAYASKSTVPELEAIEVAAVIGAVLTPLAGLHGAIFKFYTNGAAKPPPAA